MRRTAQCFALSLVAFATVSFANTVQIVTGDDYAPFAAKALPEGGLTTNVVKQVYKSLNQDVKIDWQSWSQGYSNAKSGQYAATFPYGHSPQRDKDFIYSDSLYDMKLMTYSKPGSKLNVADINSFKGKTLCLPADWSPSAKFQALIDSGNLKIQDAKDVSACAQMVVEGKADFFNADPDQGNAAIKKIGANASQIVASTDAVDVKSLHLIAPKADPKSAEIISKFNAGLKDLKAKGEYSKIVSIYNAK